MLKTAPMEMFATHNQGCEKALNCHVWCQNSRDCSLCTVLFLQLGHDFQRDNCDEC